MIHIPRSNAEMMKPQKKRLSPSVAAAAFWEDLIETYNLTIHNSEEATRSRAKAECHSVIDLTLSKGNGDGDSWSRFQ